ncbi:MAG: translation initiation factor eIF-1A [Candidatus Aenigmarchaeota archaeon]|nr:translation initiation factor eIF-1A [Candidatus Aenigmarchaeota archaeon]
MEEEVIRVRTPKDDEIIGIVMALLGGGRMEVSCNDGNSRVCRIPGRMRRRLWLKPGNLVLIKPWIVQADERADVIWKYSKAQALWLQRKGFLKKISLDVLV